MIHGHPEAAVTITRADHTSTGQPRFGIAFTQYLSFLRRTRKDVTIASKVIARSRHNQQPPPSPPPPPPPPDHRAQAEKGSGADSESAPEQTAGAIRIEIVIPPPIAG